MNWHETIEYIREKAEYQDLVIDAYFDKDLKANVERFRNTDEFKETLRYIKIYAPQAESILDIGSGNGISVIAFALAGYHVTAIEPDPSETIGAGAIRSLIQEYGLEGKVEVLESYAEELNFPPNHFDVVYARQSMHHANNLKQFVKESVKGLKKGGIFFSVRDHVIYNNEDKQRFLKNHLLHKFYGGENAFTQEEYEEAITEASLSIKETFRHFDSVINYCPMTNDGFEKYKEAYYKGVEEGLQKKLSFIGRLPFVKSLYLKRKNDYLNESHISGRLYSYIAIKK